MQAFDFGAHLDPQLGVEVRQRLVEQKQLRLARQGPAHGHPLALTARELAGFAVEQVLHLQHARHLIDAALPLGLGHIAHFQRKTDVVGHRHGGVERVALKHHGDVALRRGHTHHIATANAQLAAAGLFQARNDVEQGGLAAARWADQDEEFAGLNGDVDALEHLDLLVALAKTFVDAFDFQ